MSRIHQLDNTTRELLSSSQYITDTVSVAKELIDNSLDAGATSIDVEVSSNVIDLIQVKDNGHGVRPADINLLARRACTSKINNYGDLVVLGGRYLGFRGMALHDIATVSGSMEIFTRVDTEPAGLRLHFSQNGEIIGHTPQAGNPGTTVKIRDFLTSIPVRQQTITKECTKQLKKIKLMIQTYALARSNVKFCYSVHEAQQRTIIEAASNAFGSDVVSDCMSRYWSSTLGFVEREEPDLHVVEEEHYAITALILKPDIRFTKRNENGQYCSVDFRPVVSTKGTMKKVVAIYRHYLQQCLEGEVKNPFLCLNIMCPIRSYDPNIEPAKDDVLFTVEERILEIVEGFFQAVYGEAIEDRATRQLPIDQGLSVIHSTPYPKPLVILSQASQISNSTAVSAFSSHLDLDEIAQPKEVECQEKADQTSSLTVHTDRQPFVDISTLSSGIHKDTPCSTAGSQDLTDTEDRSQPVFRNPFEKAEMNAAWKRLCAERAQGITENVPNILRSVGEGDQSHHKIASLAPLYKSTGSRGSASLISAPSTKLTSLASNRTVNRNAERYNGFAPSTIHAKTSKTTGAKVPQGPLDMYFRPSTTGPVFGPLVNKVSSPAGTPLSQIPANLGHKRKAPVTHTVEGPDPAYATPTKRFNSKQRPVFSSPQARVSFAPTFSHSSQSPINHRQATTNFKPGIGLVTPETSPLKHQHQAISFSNHKPVNQNIQFPPTPTSTRKPGFTKSILHISPTVQDVKLSFNVLAKHDAYTANLKRRTIGFDLLHLTNDQAEQVIQRCHRTVERLVDVESETRCERRLGEAKRGYDVDLEMEFDISDEVEFA